MSTHEEQIAMLTEKLNMLENESRRLLIALNWASKVRMILLGCIVLFVGISLWMFYSLYIDIRTNRFAEVQRIINQQPEEFSEPLTRQVMLLAEEQGPHVIEVFRKQAQEDSELYVRAFDEERTKLINSLQANLESKLQDSYAEMLVEQEEMLRNEFPVLKDPEKLANIRANMERVYDKIGKRYLVDSLKEEMESIATKIDTFPASDPKVDNIPLGEQIATEMLELVRMMLVHSENYVIPEAPQTVALTSEEAVDGPSQVDVDAAGLDKPPTPDEDVDSDESSDDGDKGGDGEEGKESGDDDDSGE